MRLQAGSAWLTQSQLADLFGTSVQNISQHLRGIFAEGELPPAATIKKALIVRVAGERAVTRE